LAPVGGEDSPDWDAELAQLVNQERATRVTLADIAGLEPVKQRLEASFLGPMRNPEFRRMYGATMRGGLLLWGPPGCGKTFLARAVAGELGAHFASVGLHDVLDMWLGNSEKKLHDLFELARRRTPTVLFFDEIDAIGHARVNLNRSAGRNVVAQLLTELDGVDNSNDGVFVIGATNQPWDVDPALRRPGRLDRSLLVLPPDPAARKAIVEYHLRQRPVMVESFASVVSATEDFSGADLRLVCEEAAQRAMAEAVRTGVPKPIGIADLMASARSLRPSTTAWLEMARNFATYSNAAGEYDELVVYLRTRGKPGRG
jgi:SpoVK/Ycf46/Vps4 family AAA+-type ATPase